MSEAKPIETEHSRAILHDNVKVQPNCIIGLIYREGCKPLEVAGPSTIRAGSIIYADVIIGDHFQSGHHITIREHTKIGKYVVVGTNTVIDGQVKIGDYVKIETNCYIPTHVEIGNRVFIGPGVTMTNDRYPLKMRASYVPEGPILEDGVTIGGGVTICPGVRIGKGSFVAAGALVTKDVPPYSLVIGSPGIVKPLPENLNEDNVALNWQKFEDQLPPI